MLHRLRPLGIATWIVEKEWSREGSTDIQVFLFVGFNSIFDFYRFLTTVLRIITREIFSLIS